MIDKRRKKGRPESGRPRDGKAGADVYATRSTTSGGPYAQVGAPGSTTYTDTGLTNGTTYFYVVSASNTAGQSALA